MTLGGIAMHGVRMAEITFGERVVILGLGLLGQLAVQILKGAGCRVFGADLDPAKVQLALTLGATRAPKSQAGTSSTSCAASRKAPAPTP